MFRKCERLEVNKYLVVWLFKHLENKSQNCFVEHSEHFVFPFHSFLLTPNPWPHYTIERPYDLMICGLIVESWSMSKLMGTYLCNCYESKHLTLNTERKYLVNLVSLVVIVVHLCLFDCLKLIVHLVSTHTPSINEMCILNT